MLSQTNMQLPATESSSADIVKTCTVSELLGTQRTNGASQLQFYAPIQHTETVFTTILDNLYSDVDFQKNIARLENGGDKDKKKAVAIKNTVNKIRVYGSPEKPLLLARDVGILMGISNIRQLVKYFNTNEKIFGLCKIGNGKIIQVEYLMWKGVLRAAGNSRSTLSDLFREFIYELVAQAINNPQLIQTVARNVVMNNRDLVAAAGKELDNNLEYYKQLYNSQAAKTEMLQIGIENETQKRLVAESEVVNIELTVALQHMKIDQLARYANHYEQYVANILNYPNTEELELNILRKKFMKPLHIYVLRPAYVGSILKKPDIATTEFFNYSPGYVDRVAYIEQQNASAATSNGATQSIKKISVVPDEYCYFYLQMGQTKATSLMPTPTDELLHIDTEWIMDKKHCDAVFAEMNKECENITIKKRIIYYTCIDEVSNIIRSLLLVQD